MKDEDVNEPTGLANLTAMYRQIEETPDDLTAYGALADMLDEMGYTDLPHAYRWLTFRGKWPHKRTHYGWPGEAAGRKVPKQNRWAWYTDLAIAKADANVVPGLLLPGTQKVFPSNAAAVQFLAKRLAKLREVYDLTATVKRQRLRRVCWLVQVWYNAHPRLPHKPPIQSGTNQ